MTRSGRWMRVASIMLVAVVIALGFCSTGCGEDGVAPVAVDDRILIDWEPVEHVLDVLANDHDPLGRPLRILGSTRPASGSQVLAPQSADEPQVLRFFPAGEYAGRESFEYTIETPDGQNATATVTLTTRFSYDVEGTKTWTLSYDLAKGFAFDQTLWVKLSGEAMSALFVELEFDDQLPLQDQRLTVTLDTEHVQGILGDFSLSGKNDFAVYNKKLKGIRVDVLFGDDDGTARPQLTGVLSRVEGISESRTFVGRSATGDVEYRVHPVDEPWTKQPYARDVDGLFHFALDAPFVEGISEVALEFIAGPGLKNLFAEYGFDDLYDGLQSFTAEPLSQSAYVVPELVSDTVVLRRHPDALLRESVRDLIAAWNAAAPSGSERKRYPFVDDTPHERRFLAALREHVRLDVDGDGPLLIEGRRGVFYALGQTDIEANSLRVEVSLDGERFLSSDAPGLEEYSATLYAEPGLVELEAPEAFFDAPSRALRMTFSYARSGNLFPLDRLSIVPGSVRVYLNGEALRDTQEYAVDYGELTMVTLLVEIDEEDVVRIDFEQFRGGLGVPVEYARSFHGLSVGVPLGVIGDVELSALESVDATTPLYDTGEPRTMPNRHTVFGVVGSLQEDGFSSDFGIGYSLDRFPFDGNLRPNRPGLATGVWAGAGRVFVTHLQGVSVYEDGDWMLLGASQGLTSNRVIDVAFDGEAVLFATVSGLTRVRLVGDAPLSRVANWSQFLNGVQLPEGELRSVAAGGSRVWVATEAEVAWIPVDDIDVGGEWQSVGVEGIEALGSILDIAYVDGELFVGTENGLLRCDADTMQFAELRPLSGYRIAHLEPADTGLLVCTDGGLARIDGADVAWLRSGVSVHAAVVAADGAIWYATSSGLYSLAGETAVEGWSVSALGVSDDGELWAASEASAAYELLVWRIGESVTTFDGRTTRIAGKDPQRFDDLDPAANTDRGWLARASFTRDYGAIQLSGTAVSESPEFTSIGRTSRRDATGWDLAAAADLAPGIRLDARHSFEQLGLWGGAERTEVDNWATVQAVLPALLGALGYEWFGDGDEGPRLHLQASQQVARGDAASGGGHGSYTFSAQLSDRLFAEENSPSGGRLGLTLGWQQAVTATQLASSRSSTLTLLPDFALSEALALSGRWVRTVDGTGPQGRGTETWRAFVDWTPQLEGTLRSDAHGTVTWERGRADASALTYDGKASLRWTDVELLACAVRPQINLDLDGTLDSLNAGATLTAPVQTGGLTITPRVIVRASGLGTTRQQHTWQANLSVQHTDLGEWTPYLTGMARWNVVAFDANPQQRGIEETRLTATYTASGSLKWAAEDGRRNDLSGNVNVVTGNDQVPRVTVGMTDDAECRLEHLVALPEDAAALWRSLFLTGGVEANASWGEEGVGADVGLTAGAGLTLDDQWGGTFAVTYTLSKPTYREVVEHGLTLRLSVRVDF